jgi:hypothetical protein
LPEETAEALTYLAAVSRRSQSDIVASLVTALRHAVRARAVDENPALATDPELWMNHPTEDAPEATVISREEQRAIRAVLREWGA